MAPVYSRAQLRAAAMLRAGICPVDIFVEDRRNVNVLRRLYYVANGAVDLTVKPISLGDRDNLLRFAANQVGKETVPTIYVVDGDLSYVRGDTPQQRDEVYILDAYCIENILLTETAMKELLADSSGNLTIDEVADAMRFENLESIFLRKLLPLFILYAVANKLAPDLQTVQFPVVRLTVDHKNKKIDRKQFNQRYFSLLNDILTRVDAGTFRLERKKIIEHLTDKKIGWNRAVSGKDGMLPFYHARAVETCRFKGDRDQFSAALAVHCDFSRDADLRQRLVSLRNTP